jgi:2,4-dienoyl-CoA reductase-like NADH-dependent reductase (Old Yellow Enzyme family)
MAELKYLFTQIQIGNITLKNRIYSSGHMPAFAVEGYLTKRNRLH